MSNVPPLPELPGLAESYWMDSTASTSYPAVPEGVDVDVAVVGAGIAGICTAWELARAGRSVVVLEAGRLAAGNTGYTTAKVSALQTLIYAQLRSSVGADHARAYGRSQLGAVAHLAATVQELGISCDLERLPAFTYVESAARVGEIEAEVEAAGEAGLPASLVTETGLPFEVAAAVRLDDQLQFHPRRYLLALVEDLVAQGGRIFERSRVVGLDEGSPCRLTTETGVQVSARDVVVATGYPIFDRSLLFTRLVPRRELVVAAPIPPAGDPKGMYITPEQNTRSVRTAPHADTRLLMVTGEHFTPGDAVVTERFQQLTQWMEDRFGTGSPTYRWGAQDNTSTDKVPFIGRLHLGASHAYVASGFGGWGMTNGVLAGQLLSALVEGNADPELTKVYDPARLHPLSEAGPGAKAQLKVARHFIGDRIKPASHADTVNEIKPGGGAIVRVGGHRCAVYRRQDDTLQAVSAVCTHLGCLVAFNDAEQTWDCPCHGSRFALDGTVVNGPATTALEPRDLDDTSEGKEAHGTP
jgi:glycine/D-amino acid oxidase-like deaminating enzyme/nitrite reductase/ring-hydroxylating ferredoxin subunit